MCFVFSLEKYFTWMKCQFFLKTSIFNEYFTFLSKTRFRHHVKRAFIWSTSIYLFKVNNQSTRPNCKICSKLTIKKEVVWCKVKTTKKKQWHWRRSGVSIVNFEQISQIVPRCSIVDFEQVRISWVVAWIIISIRICICIRFHTLHFFSLLYGELRNWTHFSY